MANGTGTAAARSPIDAVRHLPLVARTLRPEVDQHDPQAVEAWNSTAATRPTSSRLTIGFL